MNLKHDSQYDYYGKKLATSCSDGKITIFDVINHNFKKITEIQVYVIKLHLDTKGQFGKFAGHILASGHF